MAFRSLGGLRAAYQRGLQHRDVKPPTSCSMPMGCRRSLISDWRGHRRRRRRSQNRFGGRHTTSRQKNCTVNPRIFVVTSIRWAQACFHALAGRPPFEAETADEVVTKHAVQPAFSLKTFAPTTHEFSAHVIGRMLAKNPAERYESYDDLIEELKQAQTEIKTEGQHVASSPPPASASRSGRSSARSSPWRPASLRSGKCG